MKKILFIILLILTKNSYCQDPINGAAINAQLIELNGQISALVGIETDQKVDGYTNLLKNTEQGRQLVENFKQIKKIQEDLQKVTSAIRDVNLVRKTLKYSFKTIQDFRDIINIANNANINGTKIFSPKSIENLLTSFSYINEQITGLQDDLTKLLKNNVFKMEEGTRLNLLSSINKRIMKIYENVSLRKAYYINTFGPYVSQTIIN